MAALLKYPSGIDGVWSTGEAKQGLVVTGAVRRASGGRVPIAVFKSWVKTISSGFRQKR